MQRSGDHWHLQLPTLPRSGVRYGFRVFGDGGWDQGDRWDPKRVLIDPYGPLMARAPGPVCAAPRWCGQARGLSAVRAQPDAAAAPQQADGA